MKNNCFSKLLAPFIEDIDLTVVVVSLYETTILRNMNTWHGSGFCYQFWLDYTLVSTTTTSQFDKDCKHYSDHELGEHT